MYYDNTDHSLYDAWTTIDALHIAQPTVPALGHARTCLVGPAGALAGALWLLAQLNHAKFFGSIFNTVPPRAFRWPLSTLMNCLAAMLPPVHQYKGHAYGLQVTSAECIQAGSYVT